MATDGGSRARGVQHSARVRAAAWVRDLPVYTFMVGVAVSMLCEIVLRALPQLPTPALLCMQVVVPILVRIYPSWDDTSQKPAGAVALLCGALWWACVLSPARYSTRYAADIMSVVTGMAPARAAGAAKAAGEAALVVGVAACVRWRGEQRRAVAARSSRVVAPLSNQLARAPDQVEDEVVIRSTLGSGKARAGSQHVRRRR
jgi:hypothetical protein